MLKIMSALIASQIPLIIFLFLLWKSIIICELYIFTLNYETQKFRSSDRKICLFLNVFAQPDRKFLRFVIQDIFTIDFIKYIILIE